MRNYVILIANACPRHSEKLVQCFSDNGSFSVLSPERTGKKALRSAELFHADAVLTDLALPRMDGLQLLKQLVQLPDPPAVFICSAIEIGPMRDLALKLGALDVFSDKTPYRDIVSGVLLSLGGAGGKTA